MQRRDVAHRPVDRLEVAVLPNRDQDQKAFTHPSGLVRDARERAEVVLAIPASVLDRDAFDVVGERLGERDVVRRRPAGMREDEQRRWPGHRQILLPPARPRRALNKAVLGLAARTARAARFGVRVDAKADLGGKPCSGW